jgi:hypothetical protein
MAYGWLWKALKEYSDVAHLPLEMETLSKPKARLCGPTFIIRRMRSVKLRAVFKVVYESQEKQPCPIPRMHQVLEARMYNHNRAALVQNRQSLTVE